MGSQTTVLRQQGPVLILACLLLHGGGFLLGWLIPRLAGQSVQAQRTISIEVGMQNSGLAVVLARRVGQCREPWIEDRSPNSGASISMRIG